MTENISNKVTLIEAIDSEKLPSNYKDNEK